MGLKGERILARPSEITVSPEKRQRNSSSSRNTYEKTINPDFIDIFHFTNLFTAGLAQMEQTCTVQSRMTNRVEGGGSGEG